MLNVAGGIVIAVIAVFVLLAYAANADPETRSMLTGDASNVDVWVNGSAGRFQGSIGSGPNQRSVEGGTPATFTLSGAGSNGIFVAVMSKVEAAGTLSVELKGCPDGRSHVGSTSAAYGLVSVSC